MKLIIENADWDEVIAVNLQIEEFKDKYPKEIFIQRCNDKDFIALKASVDDKVVGYSVSYEASNDDFYIWMAAVLPNYRNQGILTSLISQIFDYAKNNNYKKVTIKTRNDKREMLSFLVKNGFMFNDVEKREQILDNRILLSKALK